MITRVRLQTANLVRTIVAPIVLISCLFMNRAVAQGTAGGDNAVCNSTSDCSSKKASPAFIDASVFSGGSDVCLQIRFAFGQLPATGGVIDERYGASHERELSWKRAVALAWHQRDESERSARVDRHRQVELAVIVEVAGNDRVGEQPGVVRIPGNIRERVLV